MNTIIDGYNFIFHFGWMQPSGHSRALEKSRLRLIAELASRIPHAERAEILIVFDAKRTPTKATESEQIVQGFPIVFAANFEEADAMIEELIRSHAVPKSLVVVSNDNRLKTAASRRRATGIGVEAWLDLCQSQLRSAATTQGPSAENKLDAFTGSRKERAIEELSATDWLAEFDIEDPAIDIEQWLESEPVKDVDSMKDTDPATEPSQKKQNPNNYNPFPPGYGEDLLE